MSMASLALVSLAIVCFAPFVSAKSEYENESPIDFPCNLQITMSDYMNLDFKNDEWKEDDWKMYIIQDGKYLQLYKEMVTDQIEKLCIDQEGSSQFKDIVNKLNKYPFNLNDYQTNYDVVLSSTKDTVLLQQYKIHYEEKKDCYSLLSAALPCLCIYPPMAKVVENHYAGKEVAKSATQWIKDNASSGSTCMMVLKAVDEKPNCEIYKKSMEFEKEFFKLTKNSPVVLSEDL